MRARSTRRAVLFGAATALGLGVGAAADVLPGGSWLRRNLGLTGADGAVPNVAPGRLDFQARDSTARSTRVGILAVAPAGTPVERLPVCLALHGRGSSARGMAELGLPQFLSDAVRRGTPPFAIVAPDGGEHYWHDDGSGDDPMRMLTDELPGWLAGLGLAAPSAVLGISMGGFGALSYAHRRGGQLKATAVLSPALFATWADSEPLNAFPHREVWAANDPLQHPDLAVGRSLGIWCGTADVYYDNAAELAHRVQPAKTAFEPGDHTDGYWRRVLPEALDFIGQRLR
jgi:S-formylglutathione hydrolase FrmB